MKILALLLILIGVSARLLPHPGNFTPISALALFGTSYLPKKYGLVLPLLAMFLSDLIIGFYGITMLYVYGSFLLISLLGLWLRNHKNPVNVISVSLLGSILFFLVTNFGVWADPRSWYSPNLNGLLESLLAGLPFFKNTTLGDLTYTILFFGGYELIQSLGKRFLSQKAYNLIF